MITKWSISVPGSTANLGPGFDSIGLALGLYLTLEVTLQDNWEFEHRSDHLPVKFTVEDHLVYKVATETAERYSVQLPACKVVMESELPLARGLGSSASAIVAGIEIANQVCNLQLSIEDRCRLASKIEGHPDNAAASVYGGLTIASTLPNGHLEMINDRDVDAAFAVFIPNVELKTEEARKVLPSNYDKAYAVHASANANMLTASLLIKDYERAGIFMEHDLFHEPFRANLIPNYHEIRQTAKDAGAYGTAISGAGPTVISLLSKDRIDAFVEKMKPLFPNYDIKAVHVDTKGIQVTTA
ncbi:homoserine kinase [Viridibacillus sp. YIM B01967]|uniref:Homoserine kinase n=1 Tax=Viridibacillus soli TaxID=2798301 RepID=A0ABS1H5J6_9BACL|nr:homoserine kinase [Viridibacillus soli]MBK3494579.1 homoserine kinase [Viridibacillus soli]